jgi:C-terminal processing protease CtpA/Prc
MMRATVIFRAPAAVALLVAAAGAQQPARITMRRDSSTRDSNYVRVMLNGVAIEQLISELILTKAQEEATVRALRETAPNDARRVQLQAKLADISARSTGLMSRIELQCTKGPAPARGYLGISYDIKLSATDGSDPAPNEGRPVLNSVEPGSPAEKAGLRSGDVLYSIGGQDARQSPALDSILKPGAHVAVKARRAGTVREFTVLVAKRPEGFGPAPCIGVDDLIGTERTAPVARMYQWAPPPNAQAPQAVTMPPGAPVVAGRMAGGNYVFSMTPAIGNASVAGAQMQIVDDDYRDVLGVDKGLVVVSVATGSPASASGLHKLDVIVTANDSPVASVLTLRRLMNEADGKSIKLVVVRKGKQQAVTLRWE